MQNAILKNGRPDRVTIIFAAFNSFNDSRLPTCKQTQWCWSIWMGPEKGCSVLNITLHKIIIPVVLYYYSNFVSFQNVTHFCTYRHHDGKNIEFRNLVPSQEIWMHWGKFQSGSDGKLFVALWGISFSFLPISPHS